MVDVLRPLSAVWHSHASSPRSFAVSERQSVQKRWPQSVRRGSTRLPRSPPLDDEPAAPSGGIWIPNFVAQRPQRCLFESSRSERSRAAAASDSAPAERDARSDRRRVAPPAGEDEASAAAATRAALFGRRRARPANFFSSPDAASRLSVEMWHAASCKSRGRIRSSRRYVADSLRSASTSFRSGSIVLLCLSIEAASSPSDCAF